MRLKWGDFLVCKNGLASLGEEEEEEEQKIALMLLLLLLLLLGRSRERIYLPLSPDAGSRSSSERQLKKLGIKDIFF